MRGLTGSTLYVGFSILASLFHAQTAEVSCYAPDGVTIAPNESFVPCNKLGITQQGVYSSCCLLDGDPGVRDLCATSGLCLNGGVVHREFCTDPTWKSPACVNVCTDPNWGGSSNSSVELTPCTDGTFCCGHNNLTCCGTEWAVSVPTQASVISDNSTLAESGTSPSIYAVAGLGIGLGVVALVSAGVIFYLTRQLKRLKRDNKKLAAVAAPSFEPLRPMSFSNVNLPPVPPSESPPTTLAAASTHVPSMQEFAAFKALYGQAVAAHEAQVAAQGLGTGQLSGVQTPGATQRLSQTLVLPGQNPHRLSELEGVTPLGGSATGTNASRLSMGAMSNPGYDGVGTGGGSLSAGGMNANRLSLGASPAHLQGFEPMGAWREEPEQQ